MFFQSKKKRLWRARVTQSASNGSQYRSKSSQKCADCFGGNSDNIQQHSCNHLNSIVCPCLYKGYKNITTVCCYETDKGTAGFEVSEQTLPLEESTITSVPTTTTITANVFRNCCGVAYSTSHRNLCNNTNNNEQKEMFRALIGKLKESQLTTLCHAIEGSSSEGQQPDCVLLPRGSIMGEEPNVIACRIWRWPDLRSTSELKSIPSCPNEKDPVYVCCNPSHWSRLCLQDTPPPPYQQLTAERQQLKAQPLNESITKNSFQVPESLSTDGEEVSVSSWCQLAYWELAQRVGGRFLVENSSVNIFSDQPRGDGMCLKTLAEQRQSLIPESVLKARRKIGLGVTLSQEPDGVWLYNRSSVPVFVHSPTLNDIDCWSHVSKVPPGYCLRAFDYKAKLQSLAWPPQIFGSQTGPIDRYSMRISFAKGWGPNYTRQDVTACPCWLEVIFPRR